jgi:hypothetical protein
MAESMLAIFSTATAEQNRLPNREQNPEFRCRSRRHGRYRAGYRARYRATYHARYRDNFSNPINNPANPSRRQGMNILDDFVKRQKEGATFVISAQMLRLTPEEFDTVAQIWADEGGPGFNVVGVPHRTVLDGEFFISRVTVIKTTPRLPPTQG